MTVENPDEIAGFYRYPDVTPQVVTAQVQPPGALLVCSDGLWNYAAPAEELARRPEWGEPTPLERAVGLTSFAVESGGHDNITVALAAFDDAPARGPVLDSTGAAQGDGDG